MSDKLLDALDNLSEDDSDEDSDAQDVNDALGNDKQYWKSRNQAKKVQDALRDDEDED